MADNTDKLNVFINVRLPDTLKAEFHGIARGRDTKMSAMIVDFIQSVVDKERRFVDSVAPIFGYTQTTIKERRVSTASNTVLQESDDDDD